MTFQSWIMQFVDSEGSIGDLANDISTDDRFPAVNEHSAIYKYLIGMNACHIALLTFERAWGMYEREVSQSGRGLERKA